MNTLVFDTSIKGHHLEYIHHLYIGMKGMHDRHFVFVIPDFTNKDQDKYTWPQADNIEFDFISDEEQLALSQKGFWVTSWNRSRLVRKKAKEHQVDSVCLISLMSCMPFLPFIISRTIRISGIVYSIFLYNWKESNIFRKLVNYLIYSIFAWSKNISKVFILNDKSAACYLNKKYDTDKFVFLVDPISSIPQVSKNREQLLSKYNVPIANKVFLHPGGMLSYKGTIDILKAIELLPNEYCQSLTFIFAGRITEEIKTEFYVLYERIKNKVHIMIVEGFLSYEYLADLFLLCDYVLIPYKVKSQSSGIVGHAAFHKKPVVVAKKGLIGKIVKKYRLGFLLPEPTADYIKEFLTELPEWKYSANSYVEEHKVDSFCKVILDLDWQ